jgi:hypothetical protein
VNHFVGAAEGMVTTSGCTPSPPCLVVTFVLLAFVTVEFRVDTVAFVAFLVAFVPVEWPIGKMGPRIDKAGVTTARLMRSIQEA